MNFPLINGTLNCPYFIFIRDGAGRNDARWLAEFGLSHYAEISEPPKSWPAIVCFITEDREWTHIGDDWGYTLWHMPTTRPAIQRIAAEFDVLALSIGDSDDSYDFEYHKGGTLVRRRRVSDPSYNRDHLVIEEDFGDPLPGEPPGIKWSDAQIMSIAPLLGIEVRHRLEATRIYLPPPPPRG